MSEPKHIRNIREGMEPIVADAADRLFKRAAIESAISRWEKRAKSEMYLDDFLHPKARFWLIEAIESLHAQSAPESSEVESSRVESTQMLMAGKRDPAVADINDIQPRRKKGH